MASNAARRSFVVIGENIHATRTLKLDGQHVRRHGEGREFVAFADVAGMLRTINDVFVALAIDAGVDSGIIDPIALNLARIAAMDRDSVAFRLAAEVLNGTDAYAINYLTAFRAGELEDPSPRAVSLA
jgi:hypothetical protein